VSTETNGTQNFNNLRLATPYGFVDSDNKIRCASTNTDKTRALNASINSINKIKILQFTPSLDIHLFEREYFRTTLNLNMGLNYILSLKNDIAF